MKIGIDIRLIGKKQTGSEAVFFNLVKNLAEIDSENKYLLFTDITDTTIIPNMVKRLGIENNPNFKIIPLVAVRPLRNKFGWNFWTLPNYLRKNPVDIYLTQYITPFFVSKSIKIATVIHDISWNFYPQLIKFKDLFFLKLLIPLSLKRADKIIAVSRFTRDEIIKYYNIHPHTKTAGFFGYFKNYFTQLKEKIFGVGVNPQKVDWIYNAVSDNFQQEISAEKIEGIRKKYDLPEKFILYIGTLQPRKNLPALIEAYAKLPENIKTGIKLFLAGGKGHNYDSDIDKTIGRYSLGGDVIMPGFIDEDDKPAIFKLSTVFCNPSFYEGFGIPILEAMTLGIPVLAANIAPHQEVAEDSILYFNPHNPDELKEKLLALLIKDDLRKELTQKEILQAKNFSWQNTAQKTLAIFKGMN